MEKESFIPKMRLTCQFSIPVQAEEEATQIYNEMKVFLRSFNPDVTLNGQVMMLLEPCCKKEDKK